jgi:hypothetical protein
VTKNEAMDKATAALDRAEKANGDDRQSELNIADRWITLVVHGFNTDREPVLA